MFDLANDPGETENMYFVEAAKREQMQTLLKQLVGKSGRTALTGRKPIGVSNLSKSDSE